LFSYAVFLSQIRKDYDEAEKYFKLSIEADPNDSINLISYAVFLREIRKDYDKAEKYFKIANELISK
jgi:tetratricopeptide (TPR) repeat protein